MEKNKKVGEGILKRRPILKSLFTMAFPIMLANLFQATYQLTDSFWVGRLGEKAVAAVAVSMPVIFLMITFGVGFAIAGSILTAQYFGAKNKKMVNQTAGQTILTVLIVSIFLSSLGYFFSPLILKLMGVQDIIFNNALKYLRISFLGLSFNFCFFVFQSIMRSINRASIPVYVILGTVLINFLIDPLFMFGSGVIPALGVAGVALATLITQSLASIIGFVILFSGKKGVELKFSNFKPDFKFIKRAFKLGFPSSIEQSARSLSFLIMTILVTSYGTLAVAAYGVASNLIQLIMILAMGLSIAGSALIGQSLGAENIRQADKIAKVNMLVSFLLLTVVGIFSFIFARQFLTFFVPNDFAVVKEGVVFIKIIALFFGLIGIQMSAGSAFQASGNTKISMMLTIFSQWIIQIPLAYVLSKIVGFGLRGVWVVFPINFVLTTLLAYFLFVKGSWKETKIIEGKKQQEVESLVKSEEIIPFD